MEEVSREKYPSDSRHWKNSFSPFTLVLPIIFKSLLHHHSHTCTMTCQPLSSLIKLLIALSMLQASSAFICTPWSQSSVSRKGIQLRDKEDADDMLSDYSWRAAKMKLEEENTRRFLTRKPIKLPYLVARRWVQYNLGPDTREEFYDLVANGNLRTPYIPKKPEEYYTETGDWISWEHFLTRDPKVAGRVVPPATGRFD